MRSAVRAMRPSEPGALRGCCRALRGLMSLLVPGLVAGIVGTASVDTGGVFPAACQGPGPTLDEGFNVQQGVRLAVGLRAWALGAVGWRDVFGEREDLGPNAQLGYHLPDHPPLGRLWLGAWHEGIRWFCAREPTGERFLFAYARIGSIWAFALTAVLAGWFLGRWFGLRAGFFAAACVVVQPRLFAHAHIAALETCIDLAYAAAVLSVAHLWGCEGQRTSGDSGERSGGSGTTAGQGSRASAVSAGPDALPGRRTCLLTGLVWGLALLTKIQAVFVAVAVAVWAVLRWGRRAVVPLVVFGGAGLALFALGWPWLWLDPADHFWQYFARTTQRVSLQTWYAGRQWSDIRVPWHYPFVMFLVTVPLGVHLAAICGLEAVARSWRFLTDRLGLVVLAILVPLVVFAIPGVAVYDGTRLFSVVYPLWALPAGLGCDRVVGALGRRFGFRGAVVGFVTVTAVLALPCVSLWKLWPCGLSYYNHLVGGLAGAERRGFEVTYWGDAICREFQEDIVAAVPRGTRIAVAPVLHQYQLDDLRRQSPVLRRRGIRLEPIDSDIFNLSAVYMPDRRNPAPYVLVFRRKADLPTEWAELDAFGLDEESASAPEASRVGASPARKDTLMPQDALRQLFEPVIVLRRDGVWLAALLKLKLLASPEGP